MKDATRFIKHGHVRIGPNTITDPAFLVTRPMEDFLTWTDSSKVKRTIMAFNNKLDDYDTPGLSEKRKKKSTKKQQKNKQRR